MVTDTTLTLFVISPPIVGMWMYWLAGRQMAHQEFAAAEMRDSPQARHVGWLNWCLHLEWVLALLATIAGVVWAYHVFSAHHDGVMNRYKQDVVRYAFGNDWRGIAFAACFWAVGPGILGGQILLMLCLPRGYGSYVAYRSLLPKLNFRGRTPIVIGVIAAILLGGQSLLMLGDEIILTEVGVVVRPWVFKACRYRYRDISAVYRVKHVPRQHEVNPFYVVIFRNGQRWNGVGTPESSGVPIHEGMKMLLTRAGVTVQDVQNLSDVPK
jgi:hypothetical protein